MVKACCNWKDYESLAEDLFHCVKFFTLINDSKWHLAEELKSINLDVPANYSEYYPASWQYSERYNNEKMSYYSLSLKEESNIYGFIDGYFLYHDATINKEQVCKLIVSQLKENNHLEIDEISLRECKDIFNKNIEELWTGELKAKNARNEEGMSVVFCGKIQGSWFYIIGSFALQKQNFGSWAAGKRAIDIILNSLNNYDLEYEDQFYIEH